MKKYLVNEYTTGISTSSFFSCHAQLCGYGDKFQIVLLHHTPVSTCPYHSISQCSSFFFLKCEIQLFSLHAQYLPPAYGPLHKQPANQAEQAGLLQSPSEAGDTRVSL